ncbi:MAG: DNA-binding protein [Phycisphaerales bacterium]|mgnify:CR=1 FL=1|jgi:nucleoid DNA-binding protein|nr:DNA-binding protein [Phycisphaerales bacterium]
MAKMTKPLTKSELMVELAEECDLSKKQIAAVLTALAGKMEKSLKGCGLFVLPGLLKVEKKKVPAKPARKNVPNPFKPGEMMDVKAKPATTKIKIRPLKALKGM